MRVSCCSAGLVSLALLVTNPSGNAQTTIRVSVDSDGRAASSGGFSPSISGDGRVVAFVSDAANLVPADRIFESVFLHNRQTRQTRLATIGFSGELPNEESWRPSLSADGRFVAFQSFATSLVPNDTNLRPDIFVHDAQAGVTLRVSVDSMGRQVGAHDGPLGSYSPAISQNGRFVAFVSRASDLVPNDTNQSDDVFVHDLQTRQTIRVSVSSTGEQGNNWSDSPSISGTGRYIAFQSPASNLVPGNTNGGAFVHDILTGETTCPSVDSAGCLIGAGNPSISANGRFLVLSLVADGQGSWVVYDRRTGLSVPCCVNSAGESANRLCRDLKLSADGRFVAFSSEASNLVPNDRNLCYDDGYHSCEDVFVHDLVTSETTRISLAWNGEEPLDASSWPSISSDGTFVAFASPASNLVPGDNTQYDVYVRDRRACAGGTVNDGVGNPENVLLANGSPGYLTVSRGAAIELSLGAAPAGPTQGAYVLWLWSGPPRHQVTLTVAGTTVGCTTNPTPAHASLSPLPVACLRSPTLSQVVCGRRQLYAGSPPFAPWTLRSPSVQRTGIATFQGLLEDFGANNPFGFSVTNAVIIRVQ